MSIPTWLRCECSLCYLSISISVRGTTWGNARTTSPDKQCKFVVDGNVSARLLLLLLQTTRVGIRWQTERCLTFGVYLSLVVITELQLLFKAKSLRMLAFWEVKYLRTKITRFTFSLVQYFTCMFFCRHFFLEKIHY